jgi:thioredoxin 1
MRLGHLYTGGPDWWRAARWRQSMTVPGKNMFQMAATVAFALLPLAAANVHAQRADIFPEPAMARPQLQQALARAKAEHKNVLLDFGGNWCSDCHLLDIYFRDPVNKPLLEANYEKVDVNIGHLDENLDIVHKYGVPIDKGVPALVVLDSNGRVLHEQTHGRFESARVVESADLTKFLNTWKPTRQGAGR